MRAVLQRVSRARVRVVSETVGEIGPGWLCLLGVGQGDGAAEATHIADKIANLRAFPDADGKMNLSVLDAGGSVLVVSQFTLYGDTRKGRRPGFSEAAPPQVADGLYQDVCTKLRGFGLKVETGRFQTHMEVELVNDGPVTLLLDTAKS